MCGRQMAMILMGIFRGSSLGGDTHVLMKGAEVEISPPNSTDQYSSIVYTNMKKSQIPYWSRDS